MIDWPTGKRFAFTIVDDTDFATVHNVGPVYALLAELGFRTTKTVWPLAPCGPRRTGGSTLAERHYREWVLGLAASGFEIASHGATDHASPRARILAGLDLLRDMLGTVPRLHANHTGQDEAIYWGADRLDGAARAVYTAANLLCGRRPFYRGHEEGSPFFWGDACREHVTYVRNFAFGHVNTLARDPLMPYHDPLRPWVAHWFSASDGANRERFCALLSPRNLDRLEAEGGACIVYTHFACGFVEYGRLHPTFEATMRRLASRPGWFVPASTLLDYLRTRPGWMATMPAELRPALQWRWLGEKLVSGRS